MLIHTIEDLERFGTAVEVGHERDAHKISYYGTSVVILSNDGERKLRYDQKSKLLYTEVGSGVGRRCFDVVPHFSRAAVILGYAVADMAAKNKIHADVGPVHKAVRFSFLSWLGDVVLSASRRAHLFGSSVFLYKHPSTSPRSPPNLVATL